jgi:Flp pilus assembly pilin Flp
MLILIQSFVAHPKVSALAQRVRREEGQTFVEYALLIGGVSVALLAAFGGLGPAVTELVGDIATKIDIIPG